MGELIHTEGCGYYFTIWLNEKRILLFWQVENMKLLIEKRIESGNDYLGGKGDCITVHQNKAKLDSFEISVLCVVS